MAALSVAQVEQLLETPELLAAAVPGDLGVAARLRARWPADLVAAATSQADLRARAATKFDRAAEMLFTRPGLEQASAEVVARHRAPRLAAAGPLLDLCCGIGGDLLALGGLADVTGVDRDPVHLRMAAHNAAVYGVHPQLVEADVRDVDLTGAAGVFVDPARREDGRRLRTGDSEPPLAWCLALIDRVPAVAVKVAPGIDLATVPAGWEVEFVSVQRGLREAVLWSPALATARTRATLLPSGAALVPQPGPDVPVRAPGAFLLDPDPAVTRAGAVEDVARTLDAWKIDERIAFLSADHELRSAYGRGLRVHASLPFAVKPLTRLMRELDVGALDVRRRGLAGDVDHLRRRLRPAGRHRATLVLTRAADRPWALLCTALDDPPLPGPAGS